RKGRSSQHHRQDPGQGPCSPPPALAHGALTCHALPGGLRTPRPFPRGAFYDSGHRSPCPAEDLFRPLPPLWQRGTMCAFFAEELVANSTPVAASAPESFLCPICCGPPGRPWPAWLSLPWPSRRPLLSPTPHEARPPRALRASLPAP